MQHISVAFLFLYMKTIVEYLINNHINKPLIKHVDMNKTTGDWAGEIYKYHQIEEFDFEELKNGKIMCLEFNKAHSTAHKPYMYFYFEKDKVYALLYLDKLPDKEPTKDDLLKSDKVFGIYPFTLDKFANIVTVGIW